MSLQVTSPFAEAMNKIAYATTLQELIDLADELNIDVELDGLPRGVARRTLREAFESSQAKHEVN